MLPHSKALLRGEGEASGMSAPEEHLFIVRALRAMPQCEAARCQTLWLD